MSLEGDNGRFLSVIGRGAGGSIRNIEAEKLQQDCWTTFTVHVVDAHHAYLEAADGKYLSRVYRNGVNHIEAAKTTPDDACKFRVHQNGFTVSYQADNGLYLSRIYRNGRNNIEAAKKEVDVYSKFTIHLHP